MKSLLEKAYPRRWNGRHNNLARYFRDHDYSSLEGLIIRRGVMSNSGDRPEIIRGTVINVLPINTPFTVAQIADKTGLQYEAVGRLLSHLIVSDYPIQNLDNKKPANYLYTPK